MVEDNKTFRSENKHYNNNSMFESIYFERSHSTVRRLSKEKETAQDSQGKLVMNRISLIFSHCIHLVSLNCFWEEKLLLQSWCHCCFRPKTNIDQTSRSNYCILLDFCYNLIQLSYYWMYCLWLNKQHLEQDPGRPNWIWPWPSRYWI